MELVNDELVNEQILSHADLNLHQPQFPQLYLHGNVGLQIEANSGLLHLLYEREEHGTGEPSAGPGECQFNDSGVLVALVEYGQGARPELCGRVRNGEKAIVKIIYADLFVGIPGRYIHSELEICVEQGVGAEVCDPDAVERVFGDPWPEDPIQNATGHGDDHDKREQEANGKAQAAATRCLTLRRP
jgi:hypothetical protein